jgi:hypothetical protein
MVEPTVVPENKRLVVAICYVIPLLGGIVLFLIAGGNRTLKFRAFQAIVLGFIIWLYCLYGAYTVYTKGDWRSFAANFVDDSLMK